MAASPDRLAAITGAEGFIGSHLVEKMVSEGWRVRAMVCYNSFGHNGWLEQLTAEVLDRVEIVPGDVRDPRCVRALVEGADLVMHLAALIGIPYSYRSPESYLDTNVRGTLNILEAARDTETPRLLVTSTSEVYGTARYVPIDEGHPLQGQSPYSASKIAADRFAESYFRSFNLPVTIVRPFNTYGPRQSARAVIPTIITQLLDGSPAIRLGSLDPTRDLVFVRDTVEGFYRLAMAAGVAGEEVNIATGSEISVGALAATLIEQINPGATILSDEARLRPPKSEVERLVGSAEKLESLTGWRPSTPLAEGLRETVAWFREESNRKSYQSGIYQV
jgi:NAD dependent epimerase/dehydratase